MNNDLFKLYPLPTSGVDKAFIVCWRILDLGVEFVYHTLEV